MVIAPEHKLVEKYANEITNIDEVNSYKEQAALKSNTGISFLTESSAATLHATEGVT